jgi:cation diffusion facilitator family transporter
MSASDGATAILAAFAANLGIAIAKFVGFVVTGSSSMLSESIHSLADTGNQGLLLLGRRRSQRAPDATHPFGYGRERFFWAFVVALVLFSLGALFSIFEGVEKLREPHRVESPLVAIGILVVAVVLEGSSLRTALHEASGPRRGRGLARFIHDTKIPELPVVLLEDSAALLGLAIALASLVLAWQVDPVFDGVGTVCIGVLLGVIAVVLAVEMKSLLIGEGASDLEQRRISAAIVDDPDISHLIHLRTEQLGPDQILVAAKIGLEPGLDVTQVATAIDRVEAAVREAVPSASLIYLEPDLYRSSGGAVGGSEAAVLRSRDEPYGP